MVPLAITEETNKGNTTYSEQSAFDALSRELEKGIQSMKRGEVCSIEEAWEEIDKI